MVVAFDQNTLNMLKGHRTDENAADHQEIFARVHC
jgi:hypothetical protein